MSMSKLLPTLVVAVAALQAPAALAQQLAGAPQVYDTPPGYADEGHAPSRPYAWSEARHAEQASAHPQECYAKVHVAATYAPPATGPEYVWRQTPAPPGAPGPVWCLTVQPMPSQPVMVSPERLGWIRVLCADQVTPERVSTVQRRLYGEGLYQGGFDGRYDAATAQAVARFQRQRHIDHGGYFSYQTWGAIQALPAPQPRLIRLRRPTTFDTGVLDWSGKSRGF